jgi:aquacobalamin reductase/NAD(P)H-flavin reductase
MQIIECKVNKIEVLTDNVKRVLLMPSSPLSFKAGQYLQVIMGAKDKRPFSIANAPRKDGSIELHIGAEPGNEYAGQVLQQMQTKGVINVEGGIGQAYLEHKANHPIILIAGGTGFSYTWSILQQLMSRPLDAPIYLFWGTRSLDDMYAYDELMALAATHAHFTFVPVIEYPDPNWPGKTGWVHQVVLTEFATLAPYNVYVAGRFEMAKVIRDDFTSRGLPLENLYGDAYAFI